MRTVIPLETSGRLSPPIAHRGRIAEMRQRSAAGLRRAAALLREWRRRRRDRATLALLDERMLRDIGITRGEVLDEINKPFWRK